MYDDRRRIAPSYQAQDFGDTKMFIYTPASDVFANESTHDGQWIAFASDLWALMRERLNAGRKGDNSAIRSDFEVMDVRDVSARRRRTETAA